MTNKITDLENQPQQQHTSSIIKDLDNLQTLSEEELQGVVGGGLVDAYLGVLLYPGADAEFGPEGPGPG